MEVGQCGKGVEWILPRWLMRVAMGWSMDGNPTPNTHILLIIHHSSTSNGGGGAVICGEGFIQRSNLYTPPSAIFTPTLPDVNTLLGD